MNNKKYRITTTNLFHRETKQLTVFIRTVFSINLENGKISLVGIFNGGLFERRKSLASM